MRMEEAAILLAGRRLWAVVLSHSYKTLDRVSLHSKNEDCDDMCTDTPSSHAHRIECCKHRGRILGELCCSFDSKSDSFGKLVHECSCQCCIKCCIQRHSNIEQPWKCRSWKPHRWCYWWRDGASGSSTAVDILVL